MCTLFANLYVLLMWGPHMVYMGTPYIFDIYMIRCGWLGSYSWWDLRDSLSPLSHIDTCRGPGAKRAAAVLPRAISHTVCVL